MAPFPPCGVAPAGDPRGGVGPRRRRRRTGRPATRAGPRRRPDRGTAIARETTTTTSTSSTTTAAPTTTTTTAPPLPATAGLRLQKLRTIVATEQTGPLSPKSIVASGDGVVFAQNMIYNHSVTAFDADGDFMATIPDTVELAEFGITGYPARHGAGRSGRARLLRRPHQGLHVQLLDVRPGVRPPGRRRLLAVAAASTRASSIASTSPPTRSTRSSRSVRCRSTWRRRPTAGTCS